MQISSQYIEARSPLDWNRWAAVPVAHRSWRAKLHETSVLLVGEVLLG
jgi:hypothetical protein